MADEITVITGLHVSKGGSAQQIGPVRETVDMTGEGFVWHRQTIGTSAEAVTIPSDIGTAGWCHVRNRDATNYVTLRIGSGGSDFAKLLAGESALFRLASSSLYALANTAACEIEYLIVEA